MKIGVPKEVFPDEARVALTPESALHLQKLGHACFVEAGAGEKAGFSDAAYAAAGVSIVPDAAALFTATDVITKVRPPTEDEVTSRRLLADTARYAARSGFTIKERSDAHRIRYDITPEHEQVAQTLRRSSYRRLIDFPQEQRHSLINSVALSGFRFAVFS